LRSYLCQKYYVDPDYAAIKCPTVLIAGDQDNISPLSRPEEPKALIGGDEGIVELVVVDSSHQQVLEDMKEVVKAMKAVLTFS
jgi:pimeloyl-ACP methyl ester carboxylesterase